MSVNHWKLFSQLKDTISKLANDEYFQTVIRKNTQQVFQKFSSANEIFKYLESPIVGKTKSKLPAVQTVTEEDPKTELQKWKSSGLVSECTVSSQTQHVLLCIESAENDDALLKRIESFILHIKQFPEGRNSAIRIGAIRILLKYRKEKCKSNNIQCAIREALALLGYADPVPRNGIRILAMDGGGIRGLLVLQMLRKLEELTGQRVHQLFDLFCGVSTGAILAFALGIHHRSIAEVAEGYKDISFEVFKQSPLWGTGSLVWSQAYYDTSLWEKKLRDHLGTSELISTSRDSNCPKLCAVSAVVNQSHLSAYVFRNYSLPWQVKSQYFGSSDVEVWQAARASAAAPTYFEEFRLGNFLHQDGGILVNNPTAVALHEAKLIWPDTPIQCIVSFGTGRTVPTSTDSPKSLIDSSNNTSWAKKFYKILDSATDTEGVHIMLNDLLPDSVYYRFNPYLTELISMVEINPTKLEQLERDAIMYLRRNEDKFQEAAKVLTKKKSFERKAKDYLKSKRDMYGF